MRLFWFWLTRLFTVFRRSGFVRTRVLAVVVAVVCVGTAFVVGVVVVVCVIRIA